MHLYGNIISILPDLIELSLNVLNPVHPQAMPIRQLSREFGGASHSIMPETPLDNVIALLEAFAEYR